MVKYIFLELEIVIEYICVEIIEDFVVCVRCVRFLVDREVCEVEVDESGNVICKFVENEIDFFGCCVVNVVGGNGGENGNGDGGIGGDGGNGGIGGDGGRGGNVNVDGGNISVWNGGE